MSKKSVGSYILEDSHSSTSTCQVYDCHHATFGLIYTALMLPIPRFQSIESDLNVLSSLTNPGLQQIIDVRLTYNHAYVIMEKCKGDSLREFVRRNGVMSATQVRGIVTEVLKALETIHKTGLSHGNLTPDSVLFLENSQTRSITLTGFHFLTDFPSQSRQLLKYYQAPEVVRGAVPTPAGDMYALGCIAMFLVTGQDLYSPKHSRFVSGSFKSMIYAMLEEESAVRPTTAQVLQCEFLNTIEDQSSAALLLR